MYKTPAHNNRCLSFRSFISEVIEQNTDRGRECWDVLIQEHPADIADLVAVLSDDLELALLIALPPRIGHKVLTHLPHGQQADLFRAFPEQFVTTLLRSMSTTDIVQLLEHFSDEEVKKYITLLQSDERKAIAARRTFGSESAGSIMNTNILTLYSDMAVGEAITMIRKVAAHKEIRYRVYVTSRDTHFLAGHITLDALIINKPETKIADILEPIEGMVEATEDQEVAAYRLVHYDIQSIPVVNKERGFLGVITADDVIHILEQEASEDAYKMSGIGGVENSYFQTSKKTMFLQRTKWLATLLLFQSVSSFIMRRYETMLSEHVIIALFLTMLIGTGGNAGNQSATLVIRGLATGEISVHKGLKVLLNELVLGLMIALLLSALSFARVYFTHGDIITSLAISGSLFVIVIVSILLGTLIPLVLARFNIDPAHSAAPFLATLMDIIGISIYCTICSFVL